MILFTILFVVLLSIAIAVVFTALTGGTILFVVFGDLIIFVLMIIIIVKLIKKFRKK